MLPTQHQAKIHADRAARLVEEGRLQDALGELDLALQQDGRNADAWLILGELYAMAGHLEPAVSYLQRAVREDYMNMRGWVMLANAFAQLGGVNLELALEQCEAGLSIDNNCADLHYIRGHVQGKLGDRTKAVESLKKALELQPGHPLATRDLQAIGGA